MSSPVTRQDAYESAAAYYHQAGFRQDAARCYRLANAFRRAGEVHESLGEYREAAQDYQDAGLPELGCWLLAHRVGDAAAACALLPAAPPDQLSLRDRLLLARCEVLDGARPDSILPVLGDVCAALSDRNTRVDQYVEAWAVAVAESVARYDQVALVFAAAVRGGRYGAAQRWNTWACRVLGVEVINLETN